MILLLLLTACAGHGDVPPDTLFPSSPALPDCGEAPADDPFRCLEDREQRSVWVREQQSRGRQVLDGLPGREAVRRTVGRYRMMPEVRIVGQFGEHVYFFSDPGGRDDADLFRVPARKLTDGACAVGATSCAGLLDQATAVLTAGDRPDNGALAYVAVDGTGSRLAWAQREEESDRLRWWWMPVGSGARPAALHPDSPIRDMLWYGQDGGQLLLRETVTGDRLDGAGADGGLREDVCPLPGSPAIARVRAAGSSGEVLLGTRNTDRSMNWYLCHPARQRTGQLWRDAPAETRFIASHAGEFFFVHPGPQRNGRLVSVRTTGMPGERSVVRGSGPGRLVGAAGGHDADNGGMQFWLHRRKAGRSELFMTGPGGSEQVIRFPGLPDALRIEDLQVITPSAGQLMALVTVSGPVTPVTVLGVHPDGSVQTLWRADEDMPGDLSVHALEVDTGGARPVPVLVAGRRRLLEREGPVPTLLTTYGGFDEPMALRYSPSIAAWMAMGGLHVVAGVRGGGDHGLAWYLAGRGAGKLDAVQDLSRVVEALFSAGYTSPRRLALRGGSQGGALVASAAAGGVPARALLVSSGVMDLLRYPRSGAGRQWIMEYGDPGQPDARRWLRQWSPYHRLIDAGAPPDHPVVLVTTRDVDPVVSSWHSYKYLAALQQAGVLALLQQEPGQGHGASARVAALQRRHTDQWTLLRALLW